MRKKIIDPTIVNLIEISINSGKSVRLIRADFPELSISDKIIHRIARDLCIHDKLKMNTFNDKGVWKTEYPRKNKEIRIQKLVDKYGDIIRRMVSEDSAMLCTIYRTLNLYEPVSKPITNDLLKYLGLKDMCTINFNQWMKQHQLYRSKKGADATRGIEIIRNPVTDSMRVFYKQLITENKFDGEGRREFHKTFGTSRKVWFTLKQELGSLPKKPNKFLPGVDNIMYGKSPCIKAGKGCSGWIVKEGKRILFRSCLELIIYLQLFKNKTSFVLSNHRIKYVYNGKLRTYQPDIVIDNIIYEIKPSNLIDQNINILKMNALQTYCNKFNLSCNYITEKTFNIEIKYEEILELLEKNIILLICSEEKFLRSIKCYATNKD